MRHAVGSDFVGVYPGGLIFRQIAGYRLDSARPVRNPVRQNITSFKKIFQFHLFRRQTRRFLPLTLSMDPSCTDFVTHS